MLSPLTWLLVAFALVAIGFGSGGRLRVLSRFGIALALVAAAAATPWAANTLVARLEAPRHAPGFCMTSPPTTAVVLAAGLDAPPGGPVSTAALDLASRRRVERAADWWREQPGRMIVMAGGPQRRRLPTSRLMAAHAQRLGVADTRMRTEERSGTTWSNARLLAGLRPALPRRVVLVTSGIHMPRARYAMEHAGFEVCPLATDLRHVPFALPGYVLPGSSALVKTEVALHEYVGLAYYRWLAWRSRPAR